jgi:uncharacterized protein (TIGR03067 family)
MAEPKRAGVASETGEALLDREQLYVRLEDCWDEPGPPGSTARNDLEELQGVWATVSGRRAAEFLIAGNRFTVHFRDGDLYMGVFDLDAAARPRTMAMRIEEGPARHRGQTTLCIYELDGDTLRWCAAGPGSDERPPAFPAEDDPRFLALALRRE